MKKILLLFFLFSTIAFSQKVKFVLLSNLEVSSENISTVRTVLDSINNRRDIDFIIIMGNLTKKQNEREYQLLDGAVSNSSIQVFLIPGVKETFELGDTWLNFLPNISDDKFAFVKNSYAFIGFNPALPFKNTYHFTNDIFYWLDQQLKNLSAGREKYLFLPEDVKSKSLNWNKFVSRIEKENVKLLLFGGGTKPELFSEDGIRAFLNTDGVVLDKNKIGFNIIEINRDSVIFYQREIGEKEKFINVFDKNIQLNTSKITNKIVNDTAKIISQEKYNYTLYSGINYWGGKIYFASQEGIVTCIDSTGKFLWDYDSYGNIFSKPVIADRILAGITYQGDLFTISAVSGEPIQSIGFDDQAVTDLTVINYKGTKELMMPKLSKSKSALVFGTLSGKIHCYDLETLQEYWTNSSAKGAIISKPIEINNKIYFISRDGFLYCVDALDGILIWRWKPAKEIDVIDQIISANDKNIFVITSDGTVYSINMLLGKYDWKKENLKVIPSIGMSADKKRIFVKSKMDKIFILSTQNGNLIKDIKFENGFDNYHYPILERNGLELVPSKGAIYSIDDKYKVEKIISIGNAPINEIIQLDENKFLTSDIDCDITIYKLH